MQSYVVCIQVHITSNIFSSQKTNISAYCHRLLSAIGKRENVTQLSTYCPGPSSKALWDEVWGTELK
jgi:hypothetical protein